MQTSVLPRVHQRAASVLLVATAFGLITYALISARGALFFSDDWNAIIQYDTRSWFEPFNGHISPVPVGAFQLSFDLFGWSAWPMRLLGATTFAAAGGGAYLATRRRVGPWLALAAAIAVLGFPAAHLNVMLPFLINFNIPLACSVLAVWALEGDGRRWILAPALIAVALCTSSLGLVAAVPPMVHMLVRRPGDRWPLLTVSWVVVIWFVVWITSGAGEATDVGPSTAVRAGWTWTFDVFRTTALGSTVLGAVLFVVVVVVIAAGAVLAGPRDPAVIQWLVAAVLLIAMLATRADGPWAEGAPPWYLTAIMFFVVLSTVEAVAVVASDDRAKTFLPRGAEFLVGAVIVVLLVTNIVRTASAIEDEGDEMARFWTNVQVWLAGAEALGTDADRSRPLPLNFVVIDTGEYLDFVRRHGSPVEAPLDIDEIDDADRIAADEVFVRESGLDWKLGTCHSSEPDDDAGADGGAAGVGGSDVEGLTIRGPARVGIDGPSGTNVVVTRFAPPGVTAPVFALDEAGPLVIDVPGDSSPLPWTIVATGGRVTLC